MHCMRLILTYKWCVKSQNLASGLMDERLIAGCNPKRHGCRVWERGVNPEAKFCDFTYLKYELLHRKLTKSSIMKDEV